MMDCLQAQGIISEALDKAPVESGLLGEAKKHCTTCPECNSFVRSLAAAARAPLPEPDPQLHDRIMSAVRAEAATKAAAESDDRPQTPVTEGDVMELPTGGAATGGERLKEMLGNPRNRRPLIAWASAAAAVLVVTGALAGQGVRQILVPGGTADMQVGIESASAPFAYDDKAADTLSLQSDEYSASPQDGAQAPNGRTATVLAGNYVSYGGAAYLLAGNAPDVDTGRLAKKGTVNTALDSGSAPRPHDVYASETDARRIYLEREPGSLIAFDMVTRTFAGQTYALQTGDIPSYGAWPTLPGSIARPSSDDGEPVFRLVDTETNGARIFEPKAYGAAVGIGVGPDTPVSDPAGGNPDWTWWTPLR